MELPVVDGVAWRPLRQPEEDRRRADAFQQAVHVPDVVLSCFFDDTPHRRRIAGFHEQAQKNLETHRACVGASDTEGPAHGIALEERIALAPGREHLDDDSLRPVEPLAPSAAQEGRRTGPRHTRIEDLHPQPPRQQFRKRLPAESAKRRSRPETDDVRARPVDRGPPQLDGLVEGAVPEGVVEMRGVKKLVVTPHRIGSCPDHPASSATRASRFRLQDHP